MEKIFEEIVYIMHNDYAGWKDKKGCDNPTFFLQKIKELQGEKLLSKEIFKELVDDYLLDFNDSHIHFGVANSQNEERKERGFKVRRYEDSLYVTNVNAEQRLQLGMRFVSLGGHSIPELKNRHHRLLGENHAEREDWTPILSLYEEGEIENSKGIRSGFTFEFYNKKPYNPTYSVQQLTKDTILITMTDFANPDAIVKMMTNNKTLLESMDKWIIDVRVNYGGSDSSFYPMLPYLMPEEGVELADPEEKMLINCTEASADRILAELEEDLAATEDENARVFLNIFKREWKRNRGKGFVEFDFSDIVNDTFVKGTKHPSSIIVLADVTCGSSGDSFIEIVKKSSKVTVIGRATMGLNDYANLVSVKWEAGFDLMYPSSRLSRIDKGEGMTGVGIKPHIHIPWTPAHINEDFDMKKAFELLSRSNVEVN